MVTSLHAAPLHNSLPTINATTWKRSFCNSPEGSCAMPENFSWQGAVSVWWRDFSVYRRTWKLNILPNFFEPFFFLLGLGLGVGHYINEVMGVPYPIFTAPGLIAMAAMNGASFEATYNVYVRMNYERTYDAMLATPVSE